MTAPLINFRPPAGEQADWLAYYLAVQRGTDKRIRTALLQAAIDAERAVIYLAGKQGIGAAVQRAQANQVRKQLRALISALFKKQIGPLIKAGRLVAVEAAARASMKELDPFFREIYPNPNTRKAFQDAYATQARRSIDTMMTRVQGHSYVPLAQSVYKTDRLASGYVDRIVNSNLARGASAKEIAAQVRSSINPNVRGGVSYAAFRLGRTELNNAFHAQSIAQAQDSPFVSDMVWNLSGSHKPDPGDECEEYAATRIFSKDAVPLKPHPQCKCFVTPNLVSWGEFRQSLLAGEYAGLQRAA